MLEDVTLKRSVEFAVTNEKLAASFYNTLAERFKDDEEIHGIFSTLAEDEVAHEKQFRALLDKVPAEEKGSKDDVKYQYLAAASMSQLFEGKEGPLKGIDKIKTRDDALGRAFALEKASLLYYQALEDVLGKSDILDAIIRAEKNHMVNVMKYLITEAKVRGIADKW